MIKDFFNYFLISSVIIGFCFVFFTSFSKLGRDKSIVYLNLVVAFLVLNYLQIVLIDNVFTNANFFVKTLRMPFYALILPAFYTFVTYYLNVENKIKSYVFYSSLLFIVEMIIRVIFFKYYFNDDENYIVAKYRQIEEIVNILFSLYLFIKAFLLLFNRQKLYQYILSFDNIKWLKKFMYISCFIMLSWLIAVIFNLDKVLHPQVSIYYPLRFSCSILVFWLAHQGFFNYSLLSERIELRTAIAKKEIKLNSHFKNINIIGLKNENFNKIKNHIEHNDCYLNPEFSLEKLASDLKMSESSLSHIINKESNYNFSDYINLLRVEKAKILLTDSEFKDYTILSIGLECGFNSKSTFYLAFKKFTNTTPTLYRNQKV